MFTKYRQKACGTMNVPLWHRSVIQRFSPVVHKTFQKNTAKQLPSMQAIIADCFNRHNCVFPIQERRKTNSQKQNFHPPS